MCNYGLQAIPRCDGRNEADECLPRGITPHTGHVTAVPPGQVPAQSGSPGPEQSAAAVQEPAGRTEPGQTSPTQPVWQTAVSTAARAGLAVVWLWAGIAKLQDLDGSVAAVEEYQLVPDAIAELIGLGLPVLEIGLGLLLAFGLLTRAAAVVSAVMFVVFIAGLAQAQARGLVIECGCFGSAEAGGTVSKYSEIIRDVGFLAMAGWLAVKPRTWLAADNLLSPSPGPEDLEEAELEEAELEGA